MGNKESLSSRQNSVIDDKLPDKEYKSINNNQISSLSKNNTENANSDYDDIIGHSDQKL